MKRCIEWAKLTWPEASDIVAKHPVAILPLGAIEEHGPHMRLESDNRAAVEFSTRLATESGCVLLPLLPYGQVWSLKNFPGSLTIGNETLVAVITDICHSLAEKGFRGVVGVTCHLGNLNSLKLAARKLHDSGDVPLLSLFYPGLSEIASKVCQSKRSHHGIIHADEIETSLLLELAPDCVEMSKAAPEYPDFPPGFDEQALPWDLVSRTGVFGDPTKATREKGKIMIDEVIAKALALIEAFRANAK